MRILEIVVREDKSIYAIVDYVEDLQLRIKIVNGEITQPLYYLNQFNGIDIIDKFGNSHYDAFSIVGDLLKELLSAQMKERMKERK